VTIYTDGGCDPNPGVGGWAAVLLYKNQQKEMSGGDPFTTNNRMEMTAAIRALEALTRKVAVDLFTDSQYLQKGITLWLPAWKRRRWTRPGGEIKNLDLWRELDELAGQHEIRWHWVPGHAGVCFNERCDELAMAEIKKLKEGRETP